MYFYLFYFIYFIELIIQDIKKQFCSAIICSPFVKSNYVGTCKYFLYIILQLSWVVAFLRRDGKLFYIVEPCYINEFTLASDDLVSVLYL